MTIASEGRRRDRGAFRIHRRRLADEDVTVTRIANMGKFRVAVVSASDRRQQVVESLMRAGVDCAPRAFAKEDLPLGEFVRRPEMFRDFVAALTPPAAA